MASGNASPQTGQSGPTLLVKEMADLYVKENFQSLASYFAANNQFFGFKFIEVVTTSAKANVPVAHNLGYIPQDVVITHCSGSGVVTINWGSFTSSQIFISTTGPCRVRLFVGSYWNFVSSVNNATNDGQIINPVPTIITNITNNNSTAGFTNPMTAGGDLIYGGASGTPTRLANGSAGQLLQSNGTTLAPSWANVAGAINAVYTTATAQSIGVTPTTIVYTTKVFDSSGTMLNTSTGVVTIPTTGIYTITAQASNSSTDVGIRNMRIIQGGSTSVTYLSPNFVNNLGGDFGASLTATFSCVAGDTIQALFSQTTGGNIPLDGNASLNYISIVKVG